MRGLLDRCLVKWEFAGVKVVYALGALVPITPSARRSGLSARRLRAAGGPPDSCAPGGEHELGNVTGRCPGPAELLSTGHGIIKRRILRHERGPFRVAGRCEGAPRRFTVAGSGGGTPRVAAHGTKSAKGRTERCAFAWRRTC